MESGLSFFPERFLGGQHEFKVGTSLYWRGLSVGLRNSPAGNYTLIYDRVNNVSGTPVEIAMLNSPTEPKPRTNYYAGYFKDTWRATDHLTVNIGVRFDQQHAFLTEQSKEASPNFPTLFPAATFAPLDVLTWNSLVPRLGLAWDVAEQDGHQGNVRRLFERALRQLCEFLQPSDEHHDEFPLEGSQRQRRLRSGRGEPRHER